MAEVLLFHHALGLTPGVRAFADRLRAEGHVVHTPDLFDGQVFAELAEGVDFAERLGLDTVLDRGRWRPTTCRASWSTWDCRSACCPRSNWRRPGWARGAPCCCTVVSR
ncbi:hypothetical protein [Prauserella shujinwangii]|uniref:hypothetical protein n=1 Tax=Prauserella shujinwangii TaxID=1453103 RepID=UPI001C63241A|nr:hypothetical protein [Prauserella shujinwangii]